MSFIPNIRVQSWYNNQPVDNMTDYINDKSNLLIGWATMRQLRLKSSLRFFLNKDYLFEFLILTR